MRIINKPRGSGKTTILLNTASVIGRPIIVSTKQRKEHIMDMAKHLNLKNVYCYTVDEFRRLRGVNRIQPRIQPIIVLIDDLNDILQEALQNYLGADEVIATITLPFETMTEDKEEN